jgi:hypothetical protein
MRKYLNHDLSLICLMLLKRTFQENQFHQVKIKIQIMQNKVAHVQVSDTTGEE